MNTNSEKKAMPHSLHLTERNGGSIEGVEKVVTATGETIGVVTSKGELNLRGKELSIIKYDVDSGKLSFTGTVETIKYEGGKKPLLKRIFK